MSNTSLNFDQYTFDPIQGFPQKLRDQDIYVKACELLKYVIAGVQALTASATVEGITFVATSPGAAGNNIILNFDGIQTVSAVVSAWNLANFNNTVAFVGSGSTVISSNVVQLSGGNDYKFTPSSGSPAAQFEDIRYKYRQSPDVRLEVGKQIIQELGFEYLSNIISTINNAQISTLLVFISLINTLKGSRQGLQTILLLLGIDTIVQEWWEFSPPLEPMSYNLVILINDPASFPDVLSTVNTVKIFSVNYVYPLLTNIEYRFTSAPFSANIYFSGFIDRRFTSNPIIQRV